MGNPESELGLPKGNTMGKLLTGRLKGPPEGLRLGRAKPLEEGQTEGAPEVQVPDPANNIEIKSDIPFDVPDVPILVELAAP
jgi:hypothetical protein